jgi:RNA polymerase primary sigma factor
VNETNAVLNRYLLEIGRMPLLTPDQEIEHARRVQKGDAVARERMINANLRLVVTIARDYIGLGLPLLDLISEGNIGLMQAIDRFDPEKGAKLSTYAVWWIKRAIKSALANQSKTIRLPAKTIEKITRMRRISAQMGNELSREPTEDELGEALGIAAEKVARLKSVGLRPESLDAPVGADEVTVLGENIPDEQTQTPFESLREKDFSDQINRFLKSLNTREATIIVERFGLNGATAKPLEQIAEIIGVTRERIRQLELTALAKLRHAFRKHLDPLEPEVFAAGLGFGIQGKTISNRQPLLWRSKSVAYPVTPG